MKIVRRVGLEPTRPFRTRDFKSLLATVTTPPLSLYLYKDTKNVLYFSLFYLICLIKVQLKVCVHLLYFQSTTPCLNHTISILIYHHLV